MLTSLIFLYFLYILLSMLSKLFFPYFSHFGSSHFGSSHFCSKPLLLTRRGHVWLFAFFVLRSRWFACVRHGPVRQVREHIMSQSRRSARLRRGASRVPSLDDRGVPVVDLTDVDDVQCSVCGLAGGILHLFPCCGREAHRECSTRCPSLRCCPFRRRELGRWGGVRDVQHRVVTTR